jgi:hypothetical protein
MMLITLLIGLEAFHRLLDTAHHFKELRIFLFPNLFFLRFYLAVC